MRTAHDTIHSKDRKREEAATNRVELAAGGVARTSGIYSTEGSGTGTGRGSTPIDSHSSTVRVSSSFFLPRTGSGAQPSITSMIKKIEKEEVCRLMGRMLF